MTDKPEGHDDTRPTILMSRAQLLRWQGIMEALTYEHAREGRDGLRALSGLVRNDLRTINGPERTAAIRDEMRQEATLSREEARAARRV